MWGVYSTYKIVLIIQYPYTRRYESEAKLYISLDFPSFKKPFGAGLFAARAVWSQSLSEQALHTEQRDLV